MDKYKQLEQRWESIMQELFPTRHEQLIIDIRDAYRFHGSTQAYHNKYHMMLVACYAYEFYQDKTQYFESDTLFIAKQLKALFLAASMHDLGHVGHNKKADAFNIRRSQHLASTIVHHHNSELALLVNALIEVTEFPFVKVPRTLAAQCLRDADLAMAFSDFAEELIAGLAKETGMEMTVESSKEWVRTQEVYTAAARKLFGMEVRT